MNFEEVKSEYDYSDHKDFGFSDAQNHDGFQELNEEIDTDK